MVGIARLLNQHDVDSERKIQFWSGVLTLSQNFDFLHELNRLYHVHKTQSSFNNFLTAVDVAAAADDDGGGDGDGDDDGGGDDDDGDGGDDDDDDDNDYDDVDVEVNKVFFLY